MTLQQHKLYAKYTKCTFGLSQIEYLGHVVSTAGVQMDPTKVAAIVNSPILNIVKQLRNFLGLSGYYHWFIQHYAKIVHPLTNLIKPDNFKWTDKAQLAFESLKLRVLGVAFTCPMKLREIINTQ